MGSPFLAETQRGTLDCDLCPRWPWATAGRVAGPDKVAMAALPAPLPKALQRGAVNGDHADGSALHVCPGLGTEARHVPALRHPEQLEGPHPSPPSSLRRLLAPGYTETHYAVDGQPVTVAPNHTVGAGGMGLAHLCFSGCLGAWDEAKAPPG